MSKRYLKMNIECLKQGKKHIHTIQDYKIVLFVFGIKLYKKSLNAKMLKNRL